MRFQEDWGHSSMTAAVTARETIINLRAPATQRALIDQAAQAQGKTRTDFMLEAAYEKAQQVLLDRTVFALDAKTFKRFIKILDAPIKKNKALGRLLTKRAPWEPKGNRLTSRSLSPLQARMG